MGPAFLYKIIVQELPMDKIMFNYCFVSIVALAQT